MYDDSVMEQHVRAARPEDASAIADVHVEAWREAYDGIMDPAFLDGLRHVDRLKLWTRVLGETETERGCVHVAEQVPEEVAEEYRVVGFANAGPSRDSDGDEVYAIYLRKRVWGLGFGRALLAACLAHLRREQPRSVQLWVLEANANARGFYEAAGFADDGGRKSVEVGGRELAHVRYSLTLMGGAHG